MADEKKPENRDMNNLASTKLAGVSFCSWALYKIAEANSEVAWMCVIGIGVLGIGMIASETLRKLKEK